LVVIGTELLAGVVQDANVSFLAQRLAGIGIEVCRVTFTGDDTAESKEVLSEALARTPLVLSCGGLGPTADDVTRRVAAELFGRRLVCDEALLRRLKERYQRLGREFGGLEASQAEVPEGAKLLANSVGAAPGVVLTEGARTLVLLPGVPSEVRAMVESELMPVLKERFPAGRSGAVLFLRTAGTVETELARRIARPLSRFPDCKTAYLPGLDGVDLRIEVPSEDRCAAVLAELWPLLGDDLYAVGERSLSEVTGELLLSRGAMLAVAESCTGGMLAARVVDVPGSSAYFAGGVVAYSNEAKLELLEVSSELLERHGAVSRQVAQAMACGARTRFNATHALSTTGIAGPSGASADKPVGLVYIALACEDSVVVRRFVFAGDRTAVRERSVAAALDLLRRALL